MRRGLSTGSVLVILLFVFSGIYFAGGALGLKFLRGAVGLELIPHYEFWSDLPGLVRVSAKILQTNNIIIVYRN